MKPSQVKLLLGWILALSILNCLVVIIVMINLGSVKLKVENLNGGSADAAKLSSLQNSMSDLSSKLDSQSTQPAQPALSTSTSKELTCTGTLSQNLSGSASSVGSFTDYSLSGSSPLNLTCNPL